MISTLINMKIIFFNEDKCDKRDLSVIGIKNAIS